jgi:hypothetical protein
MVRLVEALSYGYGESNSEVENTECPRRGGALEAPGDGWKGDWNRGDTVNDDKNSEPEILTDHHGVAPPEAQGDGEMRHMHVDGRNEMDGWMGWVAG